MVGALQFGQRAFSVGRIWHRSVTKCPDACRCICTGHQPHGSGRMQSRHSGGEYSGMITGIIIGFVIKMIFIYFIAMHGLYLLLIWIGATELKRYHQGIAFGEFQRISHSPLSLPVSVVIPAYNEERMILNTVMNMLRLHYPQYEVIVVNDGSKDRTLQVLIEHFNLRGIDKENGRRADAVNAGLNLARYPLLCQTDADCVLEEDALLRMARPFL